MASWAIIFLQFAIPFQPKGLAQAVQHAATISYGGRKRILAKGNGRPKKPSEVVLCN